MSRARTVAIQAFIVLFVVGQAGLTLAQGALAGPSSYLWRMFAVKVPVIRTEFVDANGNRREIDWTQHVAYTRKGVDFWNLLPPLLCAVYPQAAFIAMTREPSDHKIAACGR